MVGLTRDLASSELQLLSKHNPSPETEPLCLIRNTEGSLTNPEDHPDEPSLNRITS